MKKHTWIVLCAAVVACGGLAGVLAGRSWSAPESGMVIRAMWAYHADNLQDLVREADAVVVARVQGTRPGRVVDTYPGGPPVPFTLVDLETVDVVRGEVPAGVLTLEQTGGDVGDGAIYLDDDGGPYRPGATVLLFLHRQDEGPFYILPHPQGRFAVEGGRLQAVAPDDPVAMQLDQRPLADALSLLRTLP